MILYNFLCVLMISLLTCKPTVCEQTFKNIPVLIRHLKINHPSYNYACVFSDCQKSFDSIPALQNHALHCDKADLFTKRTYQKFNEQK